MNLYEWQAKEVAEHALDAKRAIFASPRTGKTLTAIESMYRAGRERPIIVAPISVCPMWAAKLESRGYSVTHAYELPRPQLLREMRQNSAVVIGWRKIGSKTPDEKKTGRTSAILAALKDFGADALILDESHSMANPGSDQSRVARQLAWQTPWVRLLTGTPAPNHYGGLFCQLMALDPRPWEEGGFGKSWERLAQRFLVRDTLYTKRVLGHIHTEELRQRMLPYVSVVRRQDVFGPDQWVEDETIVEMPAGARALYDRLAKDWLIEDKHITADHVLTRMMRLQQMASGFYVDDYGVENAMHEAKLDALTDDLRTTINSGESALVFHRFRWEGRKIVDRARQLDVPVYEINGDIPAAVRDHIVNCMAQGIPAIAVVQQQSGGVGISFAKVAYQFVFSEGYSFVESEQAHDRTFKPHTQRFVRHYRTADTVDMFIKGLLASKASIHETIKQVDREMLAFGRIKRPKLTKRATA
jgi:hypothetical protein